MGHLPLLKGFVRREFATNIQGYNLLTPEFWALEASQAPQPGSRKSASSSISSLPCFHSSRKEIHMTQDRGH